MHVRVLGYRLPGRSQIENDGESIVQPSADVGRYDKQKITSSVVVGLGGRLTYPSFTWSSTVVKVTPFVWGKMV